MACRPAERECTFSGRSSSVDSRMKLGEFTIATRVLQGLADGHDGPDSGSAGPLVDLPEVGVEHGVAQVSVTVDQRG